MSKKNEIVKGFSWKAQNDEQHTRLWKEYCKAFADLEALVQWRKTLAKTFTKADALNILNLAFDFGQSTKAIAEFLPASSHVVGVNDSSLLTARAVANVANPKASFVLDSLDDLEFDDASFDVVVVQAALYQIKKPETVLKELKRVLKPKGKMIVCEPDFSAATFTGSDECGNAVAEQLLKSMWHADIGKQLPSLLKTAGFKAKKPERFNIRWQDFAVVDQFFDLELLLNFAGFDHTKIQRCIEQLSSAAMLIPCYAIESTL